MKYLDKKVSCFSSYMDAVPKDIVLYDFLTSNKFSSQVYKIRKAKTKTEQDKLKSSLPAITPSGLFHTRRLAKNLINHSGLIQVDIDAKDNTHHDMKNIKELLKSIEQVCFCSYSVSGNGLFALIPISNPNNHREHFLALEKDFKEDFDVVIDKSCKDVSRLRGYSHDPDYYINENALEYNRIVNTSPKCNIKKSINGIKITREDKFYQALKIIEINQLDITGNNEQWHEIICAIANEYGELGRDFAHLVSQYSPLYNYNRCDNDFTRALKTKYSYNIGTFYYYFKLNNT